MTKKKTNASTENELKARLIELQNENFRLKEENANLKKDGGQFIEEQRKLNAIFFDVYDKEDVLAAFGSVNSVITDASLAKMYDLTPDHLRGVNLVHQITQALT